MDWSLRTCARSGHVTYRPDEPELADKLTVATPVGPAWKCLRCGAFVPEDPFAFGPAANAPEVPHAGQIRDRFIIRLLAVERGVRGFIVFILGLVVWQLKISQETLVQHLNSALPLLKPFADQIGWNIKDSGIVSFLAKLFSTSPHTLYLISIALLGYGILQIVEGTGLWYQKRWAEYLAVVATSAFIPLEIFELTHKITVLRAGALVLNLAAVLWLLWTKHLFGINGGAAAVHEESVKGRSAIDFAITMHDRTQI
jgi:uncharacterized membrane protein (DUF2068 family)